MRSYDVETLRRSESRSVASCIVEGEDRASSRRESAVRASPVERDARDLRILGVI